MRIDLTPTELLHFWEKVNKDGPIPAHCPELGRCWLWTAATAGDGWKEGNGYGKFSAGGKYRSAHRIAYALAHNGEIPDGALVCHHCDVRICMNDRHLYAGTKVTNAMDMISRGRAGFQVKPERRAFGDRNGSRRHPETRLRGADHPWSKNPKRGEQCAHARLKEVDVHAIRAVTYSKTLGRRQLAAQFNVSESLIKQIRSRVAWKHI